MKVLVTGGSGFLGSHIADALTLAGHQVVIYDQFKSRWLSQGQIMKVGNILDTDATCAAMADCEVVYHLAAMANIKDAIDRPREAVEVNIIGTLNMLEAARLHRVKRFVFSSSIYVYSNEGSFYRTTKQACEHLVHDYQEQFGLDFTVLRFGSLYGPRSDRSNGVHRLLAQALAERRIDYYGTGHEVREYIHVLDAASMSVDILAPEFANQYIHLAGQERMTSRDMLDMIREMMGGDIALSFQATSPVGHYVQTPYNFTPKLGRRLTRKTYIDLGLGLLECLQHMSGSPQFERESNGSRHEPLRDQ
jgi:UDP-glucose 4-epimerase